LDEKAAQVRLLGGFSVLAADAVIEAEDWRSASAPALLKLLAVGPAHRRPRDEVVALLWPGRERTTAVAALRRAVASAARVLGPDAVTLDDHGVALAARIDAEEFEAAAARARARPDPRAYETALHLYAGELLPGDRNEPWTMGRRRALGALHTALCLELADLRGAGREARVALERALDADPLAEPVHRALMRLYARCGRPQRALTQYQLLRRDLAGAGAAAPDEQTRALYQAMLPGVPAGRPHIALPETGRSFVGREAELAEVAALLQERRLVTIVGPGGAGKTRLALRTAAATAREGRDNAFLVELEGVGDELVDQAAAMAVGMALPAQRPMREALVAHLAARDAIVVLDGCDRSLGAAGRLAAALAAAGPGIRVLATSREPLRCPGETTWRVPSLREARELFIERAARARPGFAPLAGDGRVREICGQLQGMPLAIELVAARTATLSLDDIAERVRDHVGAVERTRADVMGATIEWSYVLLPAQERVLLRRLSVFAGGFTRAAAVAVCGGGAFAPERVGELLDRLADRAFVAVDGPRLRLLDPVRRFAAGALEKAGERDTVRIRHLDWCLRLAEAHDPLDGGRRRPSRAVEAELDNLRSAMRFALRRDPGHALRLSLSLRALWAVRGYVAEGRRWIDAALAAGDEPSPLRFEALLASATLALRGGDGGERLQHVRPQLGDHRGLGGDREVARAIYRLGLLEEAAGNAGSKELLRDAAELAARAGDRRLRAVTAHANALAHWSRAERAAARALVLQALDLLEDVPDDDVGFFDGLTFGTCLLQDGAGGRPRLLWEEQTLLFDRYSREQAIGYALNNLAWLARAEHDPGQARAALDEALARFRSRWDRPGEALTLTQLGNLERVQGEHEAARDHLDRALASRTRLRDRRGVISTTLALGMLDLAGGDVEGGRERLGEALARAEAADDLPAMAGVQASWAVAEERLDELHRAARLYEDAAALWSVQGLARAEGWAQLARAEIDADLGHDASSARALERARALLTTRGDARVARRVGAAIR
jgi:predicted ATPase/DNA-binding SARP family transcriptional activator